MNNTARRFALVLMLLAIVPALSFGQNTAALLSLKGEGLAVKLEGITAEVSLVEGDLLRITATRDGVAPRAIPDAMQVPIARSPAAPSREQGAWRMGPYLLRTDGPSLAVSRDGRSASGSGSRRPVRRGSAPRWRSRRAMPCMAWGRA